MNDSASIQNRPDATDAPQTGAQDPLERSMNWWYRRLAAHRGLFVVFLAALGIVFYLTGWGIRWQDNLLLFFPSQSPVVRDLQSAQQQPGVADDLRVDVHFAPDSGGDLAAAVAQLQSAFQQTGQFAWVFGGVSNEQMIRSQQSLAQLGPALLNQEQQAELQSRISQPWLTQHFQLIASQLGDPDGQILAAQLQHDPFDMEDLISSGLRQLDESGGAHLENGVLVSADSQHAMMVLAPRFPPDDTAASEKMLQQLYAAVSQAQKTLPGLRVWVVGPYRNYVQNAQQILRDVSLISILGTLLVAAAIMIYFRRFSTVLICMIPPVVGFGLALGIAGIFHVALPLMVLAFGGLICGATTDYGIQLIAAVNRQVRAQGTYSANMPVAAARQMFGPISMSVCTSVTGYAALALSSAPGLRQLGLFIAGATVGIWIATFIILPVYMGPWVAHRRFQNTPPANKTLAAVRRWCMMLLGAVFIGFTAFLGFHAAHVAYSFNDQALDGSSPALQQEQAQFFQVWGDLRHQAVVLVRDPNANHALQQLRQVSQTLETFRNQHQIAGYQSPADILPDDQIIQQRVAAWKQFWTPAQQNRAKMLVAQATGAAGMRPAAFDDALAGLAGLSAIPPAMQRLHDSPAALFPGLVNIDSDGVELTTVVDMDENLSPSMRTAWAGRLQASMPNLEIISGELLLIDATDRAAVEMEKLFPWVALLILIPMWIYFRRPVLTVIAGLSLAIGFVWLLGTAQWIGGGLNLLSLVPLLFTMGVAVDYGIYAASDPAQRLPIGRLPSRNPATFLCAMTTILGSGVMILAGHPMLHWIGLMLTAGITGGYLASLFLVGPLVRRLFGQRSCDSSGHGHWRNGIGMASALAAICMLWGCATPAPPAYEPPNLPAPSAAAVNQSLADFPRSFNREFFASLKVGDHEWTMVGRLNVQSPENFRLTCASELGTLIFDAVAKSSDIKVTKIVSGLDTRLPLNICRDLQYALSMPPSAAGLICLQHTAQLQVHNSAGNDRTYIFAGASGQLQVCFIDRATGGRLEVHYMDYDSRGEPRELLLWDPHGGYLFTVNFTDDPS
jgi:uncharacterized protein